MPNEMAYTKCSRCRGTKLQDHYRTCAKCRSARAAAHQDARKKGRCTECVHKTRKPVKGKTRCAYCIGRHRARRDRLLAAGTCPICGRAPCRKGRATCTACAAFGKEAKLRLREAMFKHLGNVCACCGESEPGFLTLDHKNNDGWKEKDRRGQNTLKTAQNLGWPKRKYQVLCANCNMGKAWNGGVCPHNKAQNSGEDTS